MLFIFDPKLNREGNKRFERQGQIRRNFKTGRDLETLERIASRLQRYNDDVFATILADIAVDASTEISLFHRAVIIAAVRRILKDDSALRYTDRR